MTVLLTMAALRMVRRVLGHGGTADNEAECEVMVSLFDDEAE